jgi:hypothetical protein
MYLVVIYNTVLRIRIDLPGSVPYPTFQVIPDTDTFLKLGQINN